MRLSKLYSRKRNRKGEGPRKFVKIQVPEEIFDEVKLYKDVYSRYLTQKNDAVPIKVSFEQLFRRWLDNVHRIDPDVARMFHEARISQKRAKQKAEELAGDAEESAC